VLNYDPYNETMVNLTTFKLYDEVNLSIANPFATIAVTTRRTAVVPVEPVDDRNLFDYSLIVDSINIIRLPSYYVVCEKFPSERSLQGF
jgi:hypothetical protein